MDLRKVPARSETPAELVRAESDLAWESTEPAASGAEAIAAACRSLPNAPGVYRMIGADAAVLYVGKARSLKQRVQSYTRLAGQNSRIARMIRATATMDFVRTRTETEALLLEANLIKRLRPRFNVLLRDDKSFPYILIAEDHVAPAIMKHRGARKRKGSYFGPFASAGAVGRTVNTLQKAFLIRTCSDAVFESRTRPCLLYQIKRCSAPCTGEIALDGYRKLVGQAKTFLSGGNRQVQTALAQAMDAASADLDFERAAVYRDRLAALSHVQGHQGINPQTVAEADVFALHQEGGITCIQVFFFRTSQNWGNRAYFPKADKTFEPAAVLESFLAQFYDDKPVPRLILVSTDFEDRELLARALCERAGYRVEIIVPQRGEKKELVGHAAANAREALGRKIAETASQGRLLAGLGQVLGLPEPPRRVEVYDNSHVMGTNAVGAMIVAGPDGFSKNHYRKFNIRSEDLAPGDDYGMMREVMRRRFGRLLKESGPRSAAAHESGDAFGSWPDLVLVDGGKGQLGAVTGVLAELGIGDLPVVSVATGRDREAGRETFFPVGREPFALPHRDPVLYFVQRLRDEA
ncbi:MAG TPA: excinuclease ABC subunit UvrC, partial [Propylenella sp.]|nr:excinuclease ABC subunit UvrC [Propylenella sp.]